MHPYPNTVESARAFIDVAFNKFLDKLADYGTSDLQTVDQVVQRMREKYARYDNISKRPAKTTDEPLIDIFIDAIGYNVIAALMLKKEWGEEYVSCDHLLPCSDDSIHIKALGENINAPVKTGDVGYDLVTSCYINIPHHSDRPVDVPTQVSVKLPDGYFGLIINRSSASRKLGIDVVPGIIDTGYTGPLFACVWNRTNQDIIIEKGQRVAQLILLPATVLPINKVTQLPETERGATGFGSSD